MRLCNIVLISPFFWGGAIFIVQYLNSGRVAASIFVQFQSCKNAKNVQTFTTFTRETYFGLGQRSRVPMVRSRRTLFETNLCLESGSLEFYFKYAI